MKRLLALALLALATPALALAQNAPPTRVRGTIAAIDGHTLTVTTREGPTATIKLTDTFGVSAPRKLALSDIKPNSYIGTAAVPGPDGTLTALEVVVIPEASRGSGEGHYAWDLAPNATMTNANVDAVVESNSGRTLTLGYKGGSVKVVVPENVPVVQFGPAQPSDLKPGLRVVVIATKAADGSLTSGRVLVEKDGVPPPI